ncbi:MAG: tRNA 5-methoxyuridine(34)/uridine 5-oxyacetic acid(34) synthase CmoB [Gammaproteobacteria bacterium]|nr:tRNA 5-methoxyuridine(34)/uridine 5-oxyacetic acid(34) synthase CmoB [Gammaproteobacteria bacterium]
MEIVDYDHLARLLDTHDLLDWGRDLESICKQFLEDNPHGRTPIWLETLSRLPEVEIEQLDLNCNAVTVTTLQDINTDLIASELMSLFPWRKGPFHIHGIDIDTEWRSDLKWDRVIPHISSLKGRRVLDIGCGNGYHLWRMLGAGARCAVGVDPMRLFAAQFQAIRHFVGKELPVSLLPIGIENLPLDQPTFDTIFSMGVLYHRRDPVTHIHQLRSLLKPGGELVLETLIIEDEDKSVLVPKDRYARMRNVWNIASLPQLTEWVREAGMRDIQIIDVSPTISEEQRTTRWMPYHSLKDFLDPDDPAKTIEGYPAPVRAVAIARA